MAQSSPTGIGIGSGSGSGPGPGTAPPTTPYRDPWLDPRYQIEYVEPSEVERWVGPAADWQIGVPVWFGGYRAYVVRDAEMYVGQFAEDYSQYLYSYPASVSGLIVDLVIDTRAPVSSVQRFHFSGFSYGMRLGNYEIRYDGWPRSTRRYGILGSGWGARGLMPWYWYWLDWDGEELSRLEPIRSSYVGPIDGHLVPGYIPIAKEPEPVVLPSARELGIAALIAGEYQKSVLRLLDHLNSDDGNGDWTSRRLLALALLGNRQAEDAAGLLRLSYLGDPSLAFEPIDGEVLRALSLRLMASEAGRYANEADSASGWFQLTVILQMQGNELRALELLKRAEQWGLESEVGDPMRAAMRLP